MRKSGEVDGVKGTQQIQNLKSQCAECEFAIYCFCDESQWVFRTKQEMQEIMGVLKNCPIRQESSLSGSNKKRESSN